MICDMTTTTMERPALSAFAAAEIRAILGRQGVSQRELADRIGHPQFWLSRRIGKNATVDMTLEEITEMTNALGVEAEGVIVAALRACRDSNPKPSDLEFWGIVASVNGQLAENRTDRSRWALAR